MTLFAMRTARKPSPAREGAQSEDLRPSAQRGREKAPASAPPFTGELSAKLTEGGVSNQTAPDRIFSLKTGVEDRLQYAVNIQADFVIPETQDREPLRFDVCVTPCIMDRRRVAPMLIAVKFDNHHSVKAGKVCDVRADRMLSAEAQVAKLPILQPAPQFSFRDRHVGAERFCDRVGSAHVETVAPSVAFGDTSPACGGGKARLSAPPFTEELSAKLTEVGIAQ